MIKLIASDIDGTLIPYGQKDLPQGLFPLIRRLRERGILFCPASGRQLHSLRCLFAPAAEEMCFLCENGGVVFGPGGEEAPVLSKTSFPREVAMALSRDIASQPGCQALISGERMGYVCGGYPLRLQTILEREVGSRITPVADPEEIKEDIVKISAFCPQGPEKPMKALGPKWSEWNMAVAGPIWLDFGVADKGTGIRGLCKALGIVPEEVAAFGDNWNDVAMLRAVGHPYLMDTADPALRAQFPQQCSDVCAVLEEILEENGSPTERTYN